MGLPPIADILSQALEVGPRVLANQLSQGWIAPPPRAASEKRETVLVVHAHPLPGSFSGALAAAVRRGLEAGGRDVTTLALYHDRFEPRLSPDERRRYLGANPGRSPNAFRMCAVWSGRVPVYLIEVSAKNPRPGLPRRAQQARPGPAAVPDRAARHPAVRGPAPEMRRRRLRVPDVAAPRGRFFAGRRLWSWRRRRWRVAAPPRSTRDADRGAAAVDGRRDPRRSDPRGRER